ncbi:UbiH/UbiF/VisC/COQ6 family ubiquinone biosynthesis hydroxylase [Halomonas sp. PAMB 3264]|uniref:UbiH/UbiF/VisC/COQ6 family ubiquinone biosynthesis hydroxylase n=1 Tax=Halomonas sp. PAMB 3264 TaxID=3075222 RepID=UPI00289A5323|nr:UbiH/UbiF/VisC/COQ6 family ubiquinone biosynthesis hydroxylase [Halomonas sp. PAMB 3264]WNL43017.1 UbiH/UbiF/VisC/COQ6 family ubiquinone biosynthesis hydroxylase [Halomonas sp. PAMB 3264]
MQQDHDIIIIGGGMVGAALAARLGKSGRRVALIERGAPPKAAEGDYDLRISSLNKRSLEFIEASGAQLPLERTAAFRHIEVWNQEGTGHSLFSARDSDLEQFGLFIENIALQYALWQRLENMPSVTLYTDTTLVATLASGRGRTVELDNGKTLSAELVVGADGANSKLRELAGIDIATHDYRQRAMIINVETALPQQDVSWQCFTPTGPLAMLPLPGHRASLVWYDEPNAIQAREALDDDALMDAIEAAFPKRLGSITRVVARASFPIKRQHARSYTAKRLALMGDAAHVVHPLAGQGLNIGLHDADTLAEQILKHVDAGDASALQHYEWHRRLANQAMIAATDGFHHLFTGAKPLRQLGDLSLHLAERLPLAKRLMMRQANGLNPFKWR